MKINMEGVSAIKCYQNIPVTFSLSIDATRVVKLIELLEAYKALIGCEYPNHLLSLKYISKYYIKVFIWRLKYCEAGCGNIGQGDNNLFIFFK